MFCASIFDIRFMVKDPLFKMIESIAELILVHFCQKVRLLGMNELYETLAVEDVL